MNRRRLELERQTLQKGDVMLESPPSGLQVQGLQVQGLQVQGLRVQGLRRQAHRDGGFTLIEIMAVVLIIGLLSTIVGVQIFSQVDKGRITATVAQISNLEAILELYRMDLANFPSTEEGLDALVSGPGDGNNSRKFPAGGYISKGRVPEDPWGNIYQYEYPGQNNPHTFDLWSFGADGKTGGEGVDGDIGNWIDGAGT